MIDYIINFHETYLILSYFLIIVIVVLEWPIFLIFLSLSASKLGIWYFEILLFSFIGDFFWDLLHYFFWHFFKIKIMKNKNWNKLVKINKKLEWYPLFDKLIVIKYTPPITSVWLLYLGFSNVRFKNFIKNDFIIVFVSSIIISSIAYNFWVIFKDVDDFKYLIMIIFLTFMILYFTIKILSKYIIKKITNDK